MDATWLQTDNGVCLVQEEDFVFGGMHVHVHVARGNLQGQVHERGAPLEVITAVNKGFIKFSSSPSNF